MEEDITFWIAIWGAILSSILAIIKLAEFFQDRPKLVVEICHQMYGNEQNFIQDLIVKATNQGRRPITIEKLGLNIGGTDIELGPEPPNSLPYRLDESCIIEARITISAIGLPSDLKDYSAKGWAVDHSRKKHYSKNSFNIPKELFGKLFRKFTSN